MARSNHRPSATPARHSSQAPLVDTPTAAISPSSPNLSSDKENHPDPAARDKGKGRMPSTQSDPHAAKRRRLQSQPQSHSEEEEYHELKYYNPAQDHAERQEIKKQSRALEREFNENKDVYLNRDNGGLHRTIDMANSIFEGIRQTSDATVDSRLLVQISDLAYKKSAQLVLGDSSTGVDVDEFVSKCISFMKNDANATNPTSTQARRRRASRRDDDDDDEGEGMLDWAILGSRACFPFNVRPPAPGFLLGPLSVQKKVRAQTQRRARQQKDSGVKEVRPEALTQRDLETNENNALTTLCQNIKECLNAHCAIATAAIESLGDLDDSQIEAEMRRHRISQTGGPSLFDFAINPQSFGQTVENLFYISFLIKEGNVGLQMDSDGLPTLLPATPQTVSEQRERGSKRHQAVFSIDYTTWKQLIQAFHIREPLIPHRDTGQTQAAPGARGWYN